MASYPSVFVREGIGFPCEGRKKNQRVGTPERRKRDILFVVPRGALPSLFFLSLFFFSFNFLHQPWGTSPSQKTFHQRYLLSTHASFLCFHHDDRKQLHNMFAEMSTRVSFCVHVRCSNTKCMYVCQNSRLKIFEAAGIMNQPVWIKSLAYPQHWNHFS